MSNLEFFGPYLKVERADHHINQLEQLLRSYVADNVKRFRPENQQRALKSGRSIKNAAIPKHTPTVLGDAIHNLRVSLDHAYCILVEANGHVATDFTRFPFGSKDWASIKGSINGHIKAGNGPSETVRDFIGDEAQPYPGGKHRLFDLHRLDIADKHQCILPTSAEMAVSKARIVNPSGQQVGIMENVNIVNHTGGPAILARSSSVIMENNIKSAFHVTFGKGQPLEGERMLDTIKRLRDATLAVLKGLEAFI